MAYDKRAFGNFLRKMIKQADISQSDFYVAVGITKPYFYDILSGKANPPPPEVQFKMLENLVLDDQQRNAFLDLAAEGRREVPADIALHIMNNPENVDRVRRLLAGAVDADVAEM